MCWIKRRAAFKGPIVGVSTANKHGHATPPLDISSVDVRRPVTLLIVQIIEILIPFTLAGDSQDVIGRSATTRYLGVRTREGASPERDVPRKNGSANARHAPTPRDTRDFDTLSL